MKCNVDPKCLVARISAATTTVYPQVTRLAVTRFSRPYLLSSFHLATTFTNGVGTAALCLVVGHEDAQLTVSDSLRVLAAHVVVQSASRDVFVDFREKMLLIEPNTPLALYGSLVAVANQTLVAIASLHLVPQ